MKNMKTSINLGNQSDDVIFDSQTCRVSVLPAKGFSMFIRTFSYFIPSQSTGLWSKETPQFFEKKAQFQDSLWKYLLLARVNCEERSTL